MANKLTPIFHALAPMLRGERQRQAAVDQLDSTGKRVPELDAIVAEVAELFGTETGVATVIDRQTQHLLACYGKQLGATTPRDISFCGHTIARPDEVMCVFDAAHDPRFAGNPLVLGTPNIRFYVGAPLLSPEGEALGALCAIDTRPRMKLLPEQSKRLRELAEKAGAVLAAKQGKS
jgi:GAF domain-containing protein